MIPVFETYKGSVDLFGGRKRLKEDFVTPLSAEETRVGCRDFREQAEGARDSTYCGD